MINIISFNKIRRMGFTLAFCLALSSSVEASQPDFYKLPTELFGSIFQWSESDFFRLASVSKRFRAELIGNGVQLRPIVVSSLEEIRSSSQVHHVTFAPGITQDELLNCLTDRRLKKVNYLYLSQVSVNVTEGIVHQIAQLDAVTDLNLMNANIGDEGVKEIAHLVKKTILRTLILESNQITSDGLETLVEALYFNPRLKYLNLGWNRLTSPGIGKLANFIASRDTLEYLDISNNRDIDPMGTQQIANALNKNETLVLGRPENH